MKLEGVVPIWKPVDYTSHDVVAKARRILGTKRIGHTGTLDPKVTGVLPLCVGRATRLVEYIQELPKAYTAKLVVGLSTDTEDLTGNTIEQVEQVHLDKDTVIRCIQSFIGEIEQIPPMYSAVKVDGKRLYELARQGEVIERKSRRVSIYHIEIIAMNLELPHPEIEFNVTCSKGTYIRTLCADIGKALGYPAVMGELVRTATGGITEASCVTLEQLAEAAALGEEALRPLFIPSHEAVAYLPEVRLQETKLAEYVLQGKRVAIKPDWIHRPTVDPSMGMAKELYRVYASQGDFLGLFRVREEGGRSLLIPEKVFVPEAP